MGRINLVLKMCLQVSTPQGALLPIDGGREALVHNRGIHAYDMSYPENISYLIVDFHQTQKIFNLFHVPCYTDTHNANW